MTKLIEIPIAKITISNITYTLTKAINREITIVALDKIENDKLETIHTFINKTR